ncbi:MAG TPA: hypothetical protein VII82_11320, partial [Polyangiaceae bacterium]
RSLLVDATAAMDREWQGVSSVPGSGAVDVLLLPALTSCSLHGALTARPGAITAPVGASRVLVVGGAASATPTVVLRLDTGSVAPATPDLGTPRNRAAVTAFGPGALVAGGVSVRDGTVLSQAEVYDAAVGGFDKTVVTLATARADAGSVVLATGETLLLGGVGSDGKTVLASMELVDPVTRRARTTNLGMLETPRRSPTVLRLASGEILVAGGVDASGAAVPALEWFSADASRSTQRTETLVTGSARAYVALQGGGALAVVAPPSNQDPGTTFQNTWILGADGPEPATPIPGALSQPELFGGAGGSPVLWTGDRWLRWEPWLGAFGALDALDDTPANVGTMTTSPDPGLALWLDTTLDTTNATPRFTALRFDVRGEYSPLSGPLLVTDATDTSPDRLATDGDLAFDPTIANGALTLNPGASAFVTDRTYADVRIEVDAPTGAPALLVLRDPLGNELEIGGASCPGAVVTGSPLTLTVERRGAAIDWTVSGGTPSNACPDPFAAGARLSIGVRGAPDLTRSVARNLRVTRLGTP